MATFQDGYGEKEAADRDLSKRIGETLAKYYPDYNWMVEADSGKAGVATIRLLYTDNLGRLTRYGCLLHLTSWANHDEAEKKVMRLGGEMLERYALKRGRAHKDTALLVRQNKLITDNAIGKSRY